VAGRFNGGTIVVKVLLFAGLAGWTTSAIFIAVFEPHFFSSEEKAFLTAVAITNNYELKSAQLAQRLGTSDSARSDASNVVINQTRFADAMKTAMARHDPSFKWPTGVDRSHEQLLTRLGNSKADFAAEYGRQMIASHMLTQVANREYLNRKHMDRGIRKVVTTSIPSVERQLSSARSLAARRLASGR